MRRISVISIAVLLLAGCPRPKPPDHNVDPSTVAQGDEVGTQPVPPTNPGRNGPTACEPDCEGPPTMFDKRVNHSEGTLLTLTPIENSGLKQALKETPTTGAAGTAHVHADVVDGQLVFTSDRAQDVTHVAADDPEIAIGTPNSPKASVPVKLVATAAAKRLLEQRVRASTP
jgi:hypothetical protein